MLFEPVKHCKQKSTKLGVGGDRKSRLWGNFFRMFKIILTFLLHNKKFIQ